MTDFKIGKAGKELIKQFESCKLVAYNATIEEKLKGIFTIGYGCTSFFDGKKVQNGDQITQEEADELLDKKLYEFEGYVNHYITSAINQSQFDALCSLCFNIGPGEFRKSNVRLFTNQMKFELAADSFDIFVYQNSIKIAGLVKRREAEKELFMRDFKC